MKTEVRVKKLRPNAVIPSYGTEFSAGGDLYSAEDEDTVIAPGETKLIHTGIAVEIPENMVGIVAARSSLATKRGLAPANKIGVIDCDYRGEIMTAIYNQSSSVQVIEKGERFAQLIIMPYIPCVFTQSEELSDSLRGDGGFGSTGRK